MNERAERNLRNRWFVLCCVVVVHILGYYWLAFAAQFPGELQKAAAIGGLLSQCSLTAVLAARGSGAKLLRILIPWLVAFACWYGLSRLIHWGWGESLAAYWAIVIVVQTLICVTGARLVYGYMLRYFEHSVPDGKATMTPIQFPIGSLILWTTLAAVGFAIVVYGHRIELWSTESLNVVEGVMMLIAGLVIGLTAVLSLIALSTDRILMALLRLIVVIPLVAAFAVALAWGIRYAGVDPSLTAEPVIILLVTHVTVFGCSVTMVDRIQPASFSTKGTMSDS